MNLGRCSDADHPVDPFLPADRPGPGGLKGRGTLDEPGRSRRPAPRARESSALPVTQAPQGAKRPRSAASPGSRECRGLSGLLVPYLNTTEFRVVFRYGLRNQDALGTLDCCSRAAGRLRHPVQGGFTASPPARTARGDSVASLPGTRCRSRERRSLVMVPESAGFWPRAGRRPAMSAERNAF